MSRIRQLDRVHHVFYISLSVLGAILLYRFAALLLQQLPWPSWLPA